MNTATPPSALPRGAIACLATAAFGSGLSLRVNDALLPHLAREFGVSLGVASQVISLFAIAYGLAQLVFGPVGDRYGKYRVVGWAASACSLAALGCAAAPGLDALRGARLLAGATAAAIIPLSMAWIGDVVPYERRQPVLARFLIGQIAGLSTGVWLGGFAADLGSWRAPYAVIAVLFAATSFALLRLQPRLPEHARAVRPATGDAIRHTVTEFAAVLSRPWARAVLALVFLEGMCLYGPFAFVATHVHQVFGLSLSAAGAIVMLFGLGGFAFALLSGMFVARLGEVGLAAWGGAGMVLALLTIAFAPAWGWAVGGCLLLGLGFYMMHNTLQVHATQMAPERRGAAVSAFAACFFLGQSTGVSLAGIAVGRYGTSPLLAAGATGLIGVAATFSMLLQRRHRARHG
ncbi:MAG TPA: MFS transporter [Burkholderiaceae bacterium]|nr:MFS transporter [Burkholderiaceae bacterium]